MKTFITLLRFMVSAKILRCPSTLCLLSGTSEHSFPGCDDALPAILSDIREEREIDELGDRVNGHTEPNMLRQTAEIKRQFDDVRKAKNCMEKVPALSPKDLTSCAASFNWTKGHPRAGRRRGLSLYRLAMIMISDSCSCTAICFVGKPSEPDSA
jgi:hypothetical protein